MNTGTAWVTAFGDQAEILMDGLTADDVEKLQDNDADKFDAAFSKTQDRMFSFVLRLKTEVVHRVYRQIDIYHIYTHRHIKYTHNITRNNNNKTTSNTHNNNNP